MLLKTFFNIKKLNPNNCDSKNCTIFYSLQGEPLEIYKIELRSHYFSTIFLSHPFVSSVDFALFGIDARDAEASLSSRFLYIYSAKVPMLRLSESYTTVYDTLSYRRIV